MEREHLFRVYVTESLRLQGKGQYLVASWSDMVKPHKRDTRSGDEVALDVIRKAGLSFKVGENEE